MTDENNALIPSGVPSTSGTESPSTPVESPVPEGQSSARSSKPDRPLHNFITEDSEGRIHFRGKDGKALNVPENRIQELQSLIQQHERDHGLHDNGQQSGEELEAIPHSSTTAADATPTAIVGDPQSAAAVAEKRRKDTEKEYQRINTELAELKKKFNPDEVESLRQFQKQAEPLLGYLYNLGQQNPEAFKQLFQGNQLDPNRAPSQEEMAEIQSDPHKYENYLMNKVTGLINQAFESNPIMQASKVNIAFQSHIKDFATRRFEGNLKHENLLEAQPYMQKVADDYQARGIPYTLDTLYDEYLRAKGHFAKSGGAPGEGVRTGKNNQQSPQQTPSPPQNGSQLPARDYGVATRSVSPTRKLGGSTRDKIAEAERMYWQMQSSKTSRFPNR